MQQYEEPFFYVGILTVLAVLSGFLMVLASWAGVQIEKAKRRAKRLDGGKYEE